jgi:hypothetical protein
VIVQGGVFAIKLQFPHFDSWLRNEHGRRLVEKARALACIAAIGFDLPEGSH